MLKIFCILFVMSFCVTKIVCAASTSSSSLPTTSTTSSTSSATSVSYPQNLEELFVAAEQKPLTFVRCMGYYQTRPFLGCWNNGKISDGIYGGTGRHIIIYNNNTGLIVSDKLGEATFLWQSEQAEVQFKNNQFEEKYTLVNGIYLVSATGKYLALAKPSAISMLETFAENSRKSQSKKDNQSVPKKQPAPKELQSPQKNRNLELEENLRILDEALR